MEKTRKQSQGLVSNNPVVGMERVPHLAHEK